MKDYVQKERALNGHQAHDLLEPFLTANRSPSTKAKEYSYKALARDLVPPPVKLLLLFFQNGTRRYQIS